MISTATRLRRNTFATLLALSTGGLLGGCAASADQSPEPVASATEAGPAAVVTESASPSAADEPAGSVPDGFGIPAPAGKPVISPNGSYMQSTISEDDPAMQLNPGLVDPSANEYPPADLEAAQRSIIRFMAEEMIDSRLNGDSDDVDAWWESNKHKFDPAQPGLLEALAAGEGVIMREQWQKEQYGDKYDYITSPDKVRIYDRVINPTRVWSPSPGTIAVEAQVSYKIPVVPGVGLTGTGTQTTSGTMSVAVNKDANGNWLIDGMNTEAETIQG